ncbi:ComF family protein [Idiomarina seosinensis]|uniref:ComF family protein n=1 Tax=Idiomarina seosinensis TaxID=281739 RepID=A0A432ZDL0_9GAMM|nr:ComF family protein [Idiomarina seosinensis]RUO76036.1 ComF family protein [Idiomarina seosinensis]
MLTRLRHLANAFNANYCLLCRLTTVNELGICADCSQAIPRWFPRCCLHLASETGAQVDGVLICDYWFACFRWNQFSKALIYRYKELGQTELSVCLAHCLAGHLVCCYREHRLDLPDCIVAMPVIRSRWQQRGFHHTGYIAKKVSELLGVPYYAGVLRVIRPLPVQKGQTRAERLQAARGSQFCRLNVKDKVVAVLDDVISSGATMGAAASALKKAGATAVHGWAVIYNQGD